MIIMDELPFKFIEREGFRQFMNIVQPNLFVCRTTIVKDCLGIYASKKISLEDIFAKTKCLPHHRYVDFLTKHFIYVSHSGFYWKDWKLHKQIINFCVILSSKGKEIEPCLFNWGIEKLLL